MRTTIRPMRQEDKDVILNMMRVFYASPAVLSDGSEEIFENDIYGCINENPYLDGYVIEGENGICGYSMVAKSFSTEFGKMCIWIEDLYIKDEYRGFGLGEMMLRYVLGKYENCIFRLEAEEENERAINLYKKCGFEPLPYLEMKK